MKKYLKTSEELIDALVEGKTIKDDFDLKYTLYKGIIVRKGYHSSDVGTFISMSLNPYIEEPEPFKIEVGKFYKTRGEKKAKCYKIENNLAQFSIDNEGSLVTYLNGKACYDVSHETIFDIIGPWEE